MANGQKVRWLVWFPEESFTFLKPAADGLLKLAQSSNGPTRFALGGGTSNFNIWHGQLMAGTLELANLHELASSSLGLLSVACGL